MVTGLETAGLVLAVLPLIIAALEHYNEGLKPLKDFMRWKTVIRTLVVDLLTQKVLYRNTLEKLLGGLVTDPVSLALLLDDPFGLGWKNEELHGELKRRLGISFDVYVENVKDMASLMRSLEESIGLDTWGIPRWNDARSHKKAWKKFVMCLSQKQHELILSRLAQNNRNLKSLTKDSLDLEPSRLERHRGTEPYRKVRDHAKSLHTMLKRGWCCTCTLVHSANLRLETHSTQNLPSFSVLFPSTNESSSTRSLQPTWNETLIRPLGDEIWSDADEHFNSVNTEISRGLGSVTVTDATCQVDLFSSTLHLGSDGTSTASQADSPSTLAPPIRKEKKQVAWASRARAKTKLEPESSSHVWGQTTPNPSLHKASLTSAMTIISISNLCHALKDAHYKGEVEKCLGHLTGDGRPLGVYMIGQHSPSTGLKTITLRDILTREMGPYLVDAPEVPLSTTKFRLNLSTTLASTALQLQATPWLNSSWDSNDVLFHTGIATHPYITKGFDSETNQPEERVKHPDPSPVRNRTIFNLGVLLLELSLGKPLEHFRTPEDTTVFTEFCIAKRLAENLAEETSSGYADAVTACIYCDFGREVKDHNLDNDAFRQAVYEYVVTPLEEDWKHFNRMR